MRHKDNRIICFLARGPAKLAGYPRCRKDLALRRGEERGPSGLPVSGHAPSAVTPIAAPAIRVI
jgi:hypothetical protein